MRYTNNRRRSFFQTITAPLTALRDTRRHFLGTPLLLALAIPGAIGQSKTWSAEVDRGQRWIGTWATAPQPALPGALERFESQTVRLIVHVSAGGVKIRIRISNTYGDARLIIGGARVARRTAGSDIDPTSDRRLTFQGSSSTTIPSHTTMVSDPVALDTPALSDLTISLFLPGSTAATTSHALALQTSYVATDTGDFTADARFRAARPIDSWPFLTGVDVETSTRGAAIVAFGASTTDGDGSTTDANRRWPDVLAARLQRDTGTAMLGVLNQGIIGNRLLHDSPRETREKFGDALGEAGLARFDRDVLAQAGVRYVIVALGINDIAFPGVFTPIADSVSAERLIAGYRRLVASAHRHGVRVIATTIPPFEHAALGRSAVSYYSADKESVRARVNRWILRSGGFDAVVDFDAALRDPSHPTQLRPEYDSGDHLHTNDAGYAAVGNTIPLALFRNR